MNFAGPLEVSGKFTAVVDTNADPFSTGSSAYALFRNASNLPLVIKFTDPNTTHSAVNDSMQFTMSNVQFSNVKRVRGKDYTELEVEFVANANSTDAASGFSPLAFVAVNGTSSAYN